jgi:hypothetical protein
MSYNKPVRLIPPPLHDPPNPFHSLTNPNNRTALPPPTQPPSTTPTPNNHPREPHTTTTVPAPLHRKDTADTVLRPRSRAATRPRANNPCTIRRSRARTRHSNRGIILRSSVGGQVVVVSARVSWLVWRVVVAWISSSRGGILRYDAVSGTKGGNGKRRERRKRVCDEAALRRCLR